MGCGGSKVGTDDGEQLVPLGIRPLLRHRIRNNIRIRRRRSQRLCTLSSTQLLPKGNLESSEGTSLNSSNVDTHDHDHHLHHHHHGVEDKVVAEANYHDNVANVNGVSNSSTMLTRSEEEEDMTEDKMVVETVTAAIEEAIMVEAALELEDDDYIIEVLEEERGSLADYAELDAYPGSPSFRIYCISSVLEDDIEQSKDEETDEHTTSQGGDDNAMVTLNNSIGEEGGGAGSKERRRNKMKKVVTIIRRKRGSSGTGRQQRKVIGKKLGSGVMSVKQFLAMNVKSCYIPTCSTTQADHSTRLLPNSSNATSSQPS